MNISFTKLYNITTLGQTQSQIKKINKFSGGNSTIQIKLLINIIFLLIGIFIAISCNSNWKDRIIGIVLSLLFGPLYMLFKIMNPSIKFNPGLCLNINFQDRILTAFQSDTESTNSSELTTQT